MNSSIGFDLARAHRPKGTDEMSSPLVYIPMPQGKARRQDGEQESPQVLNETRKILENQSSEQVSELIPEQIVQQADEQTSESILQQIPL